MAISLVQYKQVYPGYTAGFDTTPSTSSLIIVVHEGYNNSGLITPTCVDLSGNTFVPLIWKQDIGGGQAYQGTAAWYCWNYNGGGTAITVAGIPDDASISIYEYSGINVSSDPLIDVDGLLQDTNNPQSVTLTTEASGLVFAYWANEFDLNYSGFVSPITEIFFDPARYSAAGHNLSSSAGSSVVECGVTTTGYVTNMYIAASFKGLSSSTPGTITGLSTVTGLSTLTF